MVEISLLGSGRARVGNHPGYSTAYAARGAAPEYTGATHCGAWERRRVGSTVQPRRAVRTRRRRNS